MEVSKVNEEGGVEADERLAGRKIAVALSGGGSRAIAFHLGCLRALYRAGILQRTHTLSTISGGSVIGALYALREEPFEVFEARVRCLLAEGLVRPSLRTAFTTSEGARAALVFLKLVGANLVIQPIKWASRIISLFVPNAKRGSVRLFEGAFPFKRTASRTTLIRRMLNDNVFEKALLTETSGQRPRLIISATELRTRTAFYFSKEQVGCYRYGRTDPKQFSLAHAVAASAAYPLLLPALDETFVFEKLDGKGEPKSHRITLTDGGVYDNLGLAPLWPEREEKISLLAGDKDKVDTIICCRAGYGRPSDPPSLFWVSRMTTSFYTSFDRTQNASSNRLFASKETGKLRDVGMAYLGMQDRKLERPPSDLVPLGDVMDYPTDFSAMPAEWIEKLSKRGEQLMIGVLQQHSPHLLPPGMRPSP